MTYESLWLEMMGVPFEQGYVDAGGVRTRYLHAGVRGNPVVVFLHGFMSHAEVFMRNLAAHSEHFDTYAIDLIGMGYSDRPDYPYHAPVVAKQVRDFLDAAGIDRISLVGTSFGSRVAARFAIDFPERLVSLTLISPAGLRFDAVRAARLIRDHIDEADESTWEGAAKAIRLICREDAVFDDIIGARQKIYSQPGIHDADKNLAVHHQADTAALSFISERDYGSITVPTLVVRGRKDSLTDISLAQEIAGLIPDATLEVFEGCLHAPYLEQPVLFNRIHIEFLKAALRAETALTTVCPR